MLRRLFSAILLTLFCGLNTAAAGEHPGPQRLGGSAVTWNGNRLTVELKDASVKGVLEDMMAREGLACQVTGDLQGTVTMTIDNLTVEETVHRIMRNGRYNYTMILDGPDSSDASLGGINQLTIYKGNEVVRFKMVPKGRLAVEPKRVAPAALPAAQVPPEKSDPQSNAVTQEMKAEMDREIKTFMEEMLAEGKMSRQEYDEALQAFRDENR